MRIRGQRRCKRCETRWSYYETGSVSCPSCGSHHSVGTDDERALHTATAASLDLTQLRGAVDSESLDRLAARAADDAGEFTRGYGFVDAGRLQPLDETYLAAMELRHAAAELGRRIEVSDDEEWYFIELLRADEGVRPAPDDVPESMRAMRGLAYANAVREYRSDLRTYLEENPDPTVDGVSERLSAHVRRIRALDGDVQPRAAEALVTAARAVGRYLADGEEGELAEAEARLRSLE